MFVIKIQGGLGNQISQYAFSRLIQKHYPNQVVALDVTWCEYNAPGFELIQAFKADHLDYKIASKQDLYHVTGQRDYGCPGKTIAVKVWNRMVRGFQKLSGKQPIFTQKIESGYPEQKDVFCLDENRSWYLDGFWHNYDYTEILPQLRQELVYAPWEEPSFLKQAEQMEKTSSIGVHIRLGDYVGTNRDILLNSNYYKDAISFMAKGLKEPLVFVFSNNQEQAEKYIDSLQLPYEFKIVDEGNRPAYTDMILIGACKNKVCANSTYSYWAALLSKNEGDITIPEYYTQERKMWTNALCKTVNFKAQFMV